MNAQGLAWLTVIATSVPLVLALVVIHWQLRQGRLLRAQGEADPIAAQLPAERQRRRIEARSDRIQWLTVKMLMVGMAAWIAVVASQIPWSQLRLTWIDAAVLLLAAGWSVLTIRQLSVLWEERRGGGDGVRAEVAVARRLDGLQALGCQIFHEVPIDDFDIDHVIIGPSAVFALETKARRRGGAQGAAAVVRYDGQTLHFPHWAETRPLEQTRRQARWLADRLHERLGQPVAVIPVLCLPGWSVQSEAEAGADAVRVIDPDAAPDFLAADAFAPLAPEFRVRIIETIHGLYREFAH